jgi:hypothetical protein
VRQAECENQEADKRQMIFVILGKHNWHNLIRLVIVE